MERMLFHSAVSWGRGRKGLNIPVLLKRNHSWRDWRFVAVNQSEENCLSAPGHERVFLEEA